ncbi:MAG TPA: DUF2723 domain-containing protein [Candidatus Elarobacter sp.]|nr:DUF2723 domain-containing protein [Candidatus Elarobacter sp.]
MSLRLHGPATIAIAFVVPLAVLLATVRTSVGFWDTGDLQTVAWIAGIPYPTGYPGYVVVAWLWAHALPIGSVAARVNALSACALAASAATVTGLALVFDVLPVLAIFSGWSFAFAHLVWLRGSYADVHPLGFALAFAAVALAVRWALRADERALAAGILLAAAAVAVDNTTVLVLAGGVIVTLARAWPLGLVARNVAIGIALVVALYAYLPLRSAYVTAHHLDPTLALGIEPGRPFWDDHHPATADGFRSLVAGSEWSPGVTLARVLTPDALRAAAARIGPVYGPDEPQGLVFVALAGIAFIVARAPIVGLGLVLGAVVPAVFGATYQAEADPGRYLFMLYALTALGVGVAADRVVRAFTRRDSAVPLAAACALFAVLFVYDAVHGADVFATRADTDASDLAARVAAATRDGAIVVAPWDWATPLAYHAYVDRAMGSRIVVCALPQDYIERYAGWARGRQVAIVSDGAPDLPGFATRRLAGGTPQVYEIVAP